MKLLMLIGSILIIQGVIAQNERQTPITKVQISGMVWLGQPYYGGTEPEKYIPDSPFPYQKFYLYSGGIQDTQKTFIQVFYTDNLGRFALEVDQGVFTITTEPIENGRPFGAEYFTSKVIWSQGPQHEIYANQKINEITFGFYYPYPLGPEKM